MTILETTGRLLRTLLLRALLPGMLLAAAGAHAAGLFAVGPTDLAREAKLAAGERKLLAVLFEQEDCPACRQLRRDVLAGGTAVQSFARNYRTVGVDLGHGVNLTVPDGRTLPRRQWAERLRVAGTPALAFFDGKGNLLYRHVGPIADARELQLLGRYVGEAEYENRPFAAYLATQRRGDRAEALQKEAPCHTKS